MFDTKTIIFIFIALLIGLGAKEIAKAKKKSKRRERNKGGRIRRTEKENINKFEKGKRYEEQVSRIYRERGYTIWEHGKEKGIKDRGIDIVAKKGNQIIFIQCKNWNERNKWKISHKDIKSIRTEARDFIKDHPIFKNYDLQIRFVISGRILDKSAWITIKKSENIDFEIIKPDF